MQTTGSASADAGGGTRFASLRNLRLGQMRNFVIAELKGVLKVQVERVKLSDACRAIGGAGLGRIWSVKAMPLVFSQLERSTP